jgi:hypothetical protein
MSDVLIGALAAFLLVGVFRLIGDGVDICHDVDY